MSSFFHPYWIMPIFFLSYFWNGRDGHNIFWNASGIFILNTTKKKQKKTFYYIINILTITKTAEALRIAQIWEESRSELWFRGKGRENITALERST